MPLGDPGQELRLDVLPHQPVIAAEQDRRPPERAALPQGQRRQVQPGRPSLGPLVQRRHVVLAQRHLRPAQQRGRLLAGQRQVTGADLEEPALGAQPRDPQRRLVPARQHQPRAAGHVIGQHRHRAPAFGVVQQVHVIEHQRHRRGHRPERRPQPRHDRTGHRAHRRGQRLEHRTADRLYLVQRRRHVAEQHLGVVVSLIDRHPGEGVAIALGPLRQQRRLAVSRWRGNRHNRRTVITRQPFDQRRPANRPGPGHRTTELRHDKVKRWPARAPRTVGPLKHLAVVHAPTVPFGRYAIVLWKVLITC